MVSLIINPFSDNEGFIYFNELLYKTMKRLYGNHRLINKNLIKKEIFAIKEIKKIKKRIQNGDWTAATVR